jgi:hypothetical protein
VYFIQGTAAMRLCLIDLSIGSSTSLDNAAAYSVRRITAEDTAPGGTQITAPYPLDPDAPAASGWDGWFDIEVANTPTYTGTAASAVLKFGLNQRGLHRWCALPNRGVWVAKTNDAGLGMEVTTSATPFPVTGHMHVEA